MSIHGPKITDEIARAAALVAEHDVAFESKNYTTPLKKRANTFWMADVDHLGTQPYGGNASYQVVYHNNKTGFSS